MRIQIIDHKGDMKSFPTHMKLSTKNLWDIELARDRERGNSN
jgi:hypothetical protein